MSHIFLIGFMASGKTTIGTELAEELGLPFIDLDQLIESRAGCAISEIFEDAGEAHFRRLETAALEDTIISAPAVVATGGGAPAHDDNLAKMCRAGLVVALDAPLAQLRGRVGDAATRPLFRRPESEVEDLYRGRLAYYRRAHAVVQTAGLGVDAVCRRIVDLVELKTKLVAAEPCDQGFVVLADKIYPIVVSGTGLAAFGQAFAAVLGDCSGVGIVTDSNVNQIYGDLVAQSLSDFGIKVNVVVVQAGEAAKSSANHAFVCERLIELGLDRNSVVVALGGGVVGDLAGYVAATLYRGIRLVQVPTTLLAMTDAAIGGKTGINVPAGKNLVGAFWHPELVFIDPRTLATLPVRERRAACGELVKYAVLDGRDLARSLESIIPGLVAETMPADDQFAAALRAVLLRCASYKAWIVGRDAREAGERALLNLGHTLAHAIEAAAGYGTVLHGEAVGLGLVAACRVSATIGIASPGLEAEVVQLLDRAGLDTDIDPWLRPDVLQRIGVDKKRSGGNVGFVTIQDFGNCGITPIKVSELARTLPSQ